MVNCKQCGKQIKTGQGLRGHMQFAHKMSSPRSSAAAVEHATLATVDQVKKLVDERLSSLVHGLWPEVNVLKWDLHALEHKRLEHGWQESDELVAAELKERLAKLGERFVGGARTIMDHPEG